MQIFLIGTAHISQASSEEVQNAIRTIKPQTVFVELDEDRANTLLSVLCGHEQDQMEEPGLLEARPAALYPGFATWLLAQLHPSCMCAER